MSDLKLVNLRVPVAVLAVIDRQADREGLTRTALLLKPWMNEDRELIVELPATAKARRESKEMALEAEKLRLGVVSYPPKPLPPAEAKVSKLLEGVQVGPAKTEPGARLKGKKR